MERGHADGSICAAVSATDVIVFSALITQPLPHGPGWPLIAGRRLAVFVNGLADGGPAAIPGPAVTREDIEAAFTLRVTPETARAATCIPAIGWPDSFRSRAEPAPRPAASPMAATVASPRGRAGMILRTLGISLPLVSCAFSSRSVLFN